MRCWRIRTALPQKRAAWLDEIEVAPPGSIWDSARDTWLTTQIRSEMVVDTRIRSVNYSIETANGSVYLIGSARTLQARWRELRPDFVDGRLPQPCNETYAYVDEYLSLVIEMRMASVLRRLDRIEGGFQTVGDLLEHPAFAGFGRLLLPWDGRSIDTSMELREIGSLLPYHSHVDPAVVVSSLNRMIDDVLEGVDFISINTDAQALNAYAQQISVRLPVPALPFDLQIQEVRALPGGLAVTATARAISTTSRPTIRSSA